MGPYLKDKKIFLFINKNLPICSVFFIIRIVLFLSSRRWFSLWIRIELNTIIFLRLLFRKTKKNIERTVNYFIIQRISSLLILLRIIVNQILLNRRTRPSLLILCSLILKLGGAPFHSWFIPICFSIRDKTLFWLTISVQKIIPIIIIFFITRKIRITLCLFTLTCVTLGRCINLKQNTIKILLIISSIRNIGWILIALRKARNIQIYLLFYLIITRTIIYFLYLRVNKSIIKKKSEIIILNLIIIGGLPPLLGFIPKLIVSISLLEKTILTMLIIILLLSRIDLFVYSRIRFLSLSKASLSFYWEKTPKELIWKFSILNIIGVVCLWL